MHEESEYQIWSTGALQDIILIRGSRPHADNAIAIDRACLCMLSVPRNGIVPVKRVLRYTTNPVQCRGDAVTLIRSADIEESKVIVNPGLIRRVFVKKKAISS